MEFYATVLAAIVTAQAIEEKRLHRWEKCMNEILWSFYRWAFHSSTEPQRIRARIIRPVKALSLPSHRKPEETLREEIRRDNKAKLRNVERLLR